MTPFSATIWHNPSCSTSRKALEMLHSAGLEPQVIRYLDTGWTMESLPVLLAAAGLTPAQALRRKGDLARDLGLLGEGISDDRILAAMIAHPALVERPFVQTARGTVLCRPLDLLTDLLPQD